MPSATSSDLRDALLVLREHASGALAHVWLPTAEYVDQALKGDDQAKATVTAALTALLPGLIGGLQSMAATLAADWYNDTRFDLAVPGTFTAQPVVPPIGAESLIGYSWSKAATAAGFQQFIGAGVELRTAQAANQTITGSLLRDPEGTGWRRQASPDACWFCRLIADENHVFRSQATATFAPHDDCHCVAAPVWGGKAVPVASAYTPSERNRSDTVRAADNARAKAWARDHGLI